MNEPAKEVLLPKTIPERVCVPQGMRKFTLFRAHDTSGVSGEGLVVQGVVFADGQCAYQWLNGMTPELEYRHSFKKFLTIHVESHPENGSVITWEDGTQQRY